MSQCLWFDTNYNVYMNKNFCSNLFNTLNVYYSKSIGPSENIYLRRKPAFNFLYNYLLRKLEKLLINVVATCKHDLFSIFHM